MTLDYSYDPNGFVIDSVVVDSVSCNGGSDGSIAMYSTGEIGTISYDLGNGIPQSSNTFSGLSAGLYTDIVLTDAMDVRLLQRACRTAKCTCFKCHCHYSCFRFWCK